LFPLLLENGNLLRPGFIGNDSRVFGPGPGVGGKIQEFTWDGKLVWDFRFYNPRQLPHHDMTRLPNGNVLLIVHDRKTAEEPTAAGRRPELTGDSHSRADSPPSRRSLTNGSTRCSRQHRENNSGVSSRLRALRRPGQARVVRAIRLTRARFS